jgi:hypothetical protein
LLAVLDYVGYIGRLELHFKFPGLQFRRIQNVIHEVEHAGRILIDDVHEFFRLHRGASFLRELFQEFAGFLYAG